MLIMMGVAVTVIVADECYKAYKRRKRRKAAERDLGLTPMDRREIRRRRREREREQRELEREWARRVRERRRRRANEWDRGEDGMWDEVSEGIGLPEYSVRPRDGVDRAVTVQCVEGSTKKKGFKSLFKRRQSEPELVVEGERQRRGWFRRKMGRRTEESSRAVVVEAVEGPPPPYEE